MNMKYQDQAMNCRSYLPVRLPGRFHLQSSFDEEPMNLEPRNRGRVGEAHGVNPTYVSFRTECWFCYPADGVAVDSLFFLFLIPP